MNLVDRVKNILMAPKTEWPVIAGEAATVPGLYKGYIAILAAIPVLAVFVKSSLIGYSAFGVSIRVPVISGLTSAIVSYALGLALAYVMALIVDALAPTFGGQKNQIQALKTVAYAWTSVWVAGIAWLLPPVGALVTLIGGIYSIYLLYLGLPVTMKCPPEKAAGYTAVSFICALVLGVVIAVVVGAISGAGAGMRMP